MQSLKDKKVVEDETKEIKKKATNKKKQLMQEKYDRHVMLNRLQGLILAFNKVYPYEGTHTILGQGKRSS